MRIAVWDIRPCRLLFESLISDGVEVEFCPPDESRALLDSGRVDAALVSVVDVLKATDEYSVQSELVLASAASFPYVTLNYEGDLEGIHRVEAIGPASFACDVADIVLREQYGIAPSMQPRSGVSSNGSKPDAILSYGDPAQSAPGQTIDLGQEWFEMTTRPLVWGVFAVQAGKGAADIRRILSTVVEKATNHDLLELDPDSSKALSESDLSFVSSDLRLRFDPEVSEGLDELAHYLFYFGKVDDIPSAKFSSPSEGTRASS